MSVLNKLINKFLKNAGLILKEIDGIVPKALSAKFKEKLLQKISRKFIKEFAK